MSKQLWEGQTLKGKLFNRMKPPAEQGSGRDSHRSQMVGDEGRETGQKIQCSKGPEIKNN